MVELRVISGTDPAPPAAARDRVLAILKSHAWKADELKVDVQLRDLDMDSLDLIEAMMEVEIEFNIEISDDEVSVDNTVGEVIAFVEKKLGGRNGEH